MHASSFVVVRAVRTAIRSGSAATWRKQVSTSCAACQSSQQSKSKKGGSGSDSKSPPSDNFSNAKLDPPETIYNKEKSAQKELGPGASKEGEYKNPEYYRYHNTSYFDMEIVMSKLRNPQPVASKK